MKQTGERPIKDSTPAALIALHDAGYRELAARASGKRVLDVGCGVGDESIRLAATDRHVLGLDYHHPTAVIAAGNGVTAMCGDGGRLPIAARSIDTVCSSHIIEHFVDPEPHVADIARILKDDGSALFLTPNEPADFENPYHVHLFTPDSLRDILSKHFADVQILGLDGDQFVKADFEARRRAGNRLLRLDPFQLRKKLPRNVYVRLHAMGRRALYPITNRLQKESALITQDNFFVTDKLDTSTLVLFAVARRPVRS